MPRLPTLKAIPLEGEPVSREVRLLAVQGRRYSPALDAFLKAARLRDWSIEVPQQGTAMLVEDLKRTQGRLAQDDDGAGSGLPPVDLSNSIATF